MITKNFSLDELTASATAVRMGIDNSPGAEQIKSLERLAKDILQPVRDRWGAPLIVTSGYRSPALNKAVNGSATSQHMLAQAADIKAVPVNGESQREANKRLFNLIVSMIRLGQIAIGQLIDEYNYSWIHLSIPTQRHLNQVLHLG